MLFSVALCVLCVSVVIFLCASLFTSCSRSCLKLYQVLIPKCPPLRVYLYTHKEATMDAQAVSFRTEKGLSIVQILTQGHDSFPYISAASAMKQNMIQVKELNEAGSVNHLLVLNLSKQ